MLVAALRRFDLGAEGDAAEAQGETWDRALAAFREATR
jgi:hypothetical protein